MTDHGFTGYGAGMPVQPDFTPVTADEVEKARRGAVFAALAALLFFLCIGAALRVDFDAPRVPVTAEVKR